MMFVGSLHATWRRTGVYLWLIVLMNGRVAASGKTRSKVEADRWSHDWSSKPGCVVRVYKDWSHFSAARRYYNAKDRARQQ